jgi:hypothetical protein
MKIINAIVWIQLLFNAAIMVIAIVFFNAMYVPVNKAANDVFFAKALEINNIVDVCMLSSRYHTINFTKSKSPSEFNRKRYLIYLIHKTSGKRYCINFLYNDFMKSASCNNYDSIEKLVSCRASYKLELSY